MSNSQVGLKFKRTHGLNNVFKTDLDSCAPFGLPGHPFPVDGRSADFQERSRARDIAVARGDGLFDGFLFDLPERPDLTRFGRRLGQDGDAALSRRVLGESAAMLRRSLAGSV